MSTDKGKATDKGKSKARHPYPWMDHPERPLPHNRLLDLRGHQGVTNFKTSDLYEMDWGYNNWSDKYIKQTIGMQTLHEVIRTECDRLRAHAHKPGVFWVACEGPDEKNLSGHKLWSWKKKPQGIYVYFSFDWETFKDKAKTPDEKYIEVLRIEKPAGPDLPLEEIERRPVELKDVSNEPPAAA